MVLIAINKEQRKVWVLIFCQCKELRIGQVLQRWYRDEFEISKKIIGGYFFSNFMIISEICHKYIGKSLRIPFNR